MNATAHAKLALVVGLTAGLTHGVVDVAARIGSMGFEWFELYQPFLLSGLAFLIGYLGLWAALEAVWKLARRRSSEAAIRLFHNATAVWLIVLAVGIVLINFLLPGSIAGNGTRINAIETLLFIAAVTAAYLAMLRFGRGVHERFLERFRRRRGTEILGHVRFVLCAFTGFALAADVYLYHLAPRSGPAAAEAAPGAPNVILITLDTTRADHLPFHGYERDTMPFLASLAAESAVFENATSASSWTLPSHASLFTGHLPSRHGATLSHMRLEPEALTLAEILRERGYLTAGFAGGAFCKAKYGIGQGFGTYLDRLDFFEWAPTARRFDIRTLINTLRFISGRRLPSIHDLLGADGERKAPEINRDFLRWLDTTGGRPFFAFLNYFDAHEPYEPAAEYRRMFTADPRPDSEVHRAFTADERGDVMAPDMLQLMIDLYDAELRQLDDELKTLFARLDSDGLLDNSLIVITSDHGEEFKDHGGLDHGLTLYEEVIHVPLVIHWPGQLAPRRVAKRIDNLDVFATLLDCLAIPLAEPTDAASLRPLAEGAETHDKPVATSQLLGRTSIPALEESRQFSTSNSEWKQILVKPDRHQIPSGLYNLKTDPGETRNLLETGELPDPLPFPPDEPDWLIESPSRPR